MLNHLFRHNMSQKALHMSSGSEKCSEVELSINVYSSTRLQEECDIDSSSSNEASAVAGIQGKRHTQEMTEDGADPRPQATAERHEREIERKEVTTCVQYVTVWHWGDNICSSSST